MNMFGAKRKFLFRCDDCQMIVVVDFDEPEELKKVQEDKLVFECPCGGYSKPLRN